MTLKHYYKELYAGIYVSMPHPSITAKVRGSLLSGDCVSSLITIFSATLWCWVMRLISFPKFWSNIKCRGIHGIGYSKHSSTKNRWSYHLVYMRKHTYRVFFKELLKLFKCLASNGIHTISRWLDLLFKAIYQERKGRKERILTRLAWAPWVVVVLPLFIDIWYVDFS